MVASVATIFYYPSQSATLNTMSRVKVTTVDEAITRLIAQLPKSSQAFFIVMSKVGHPVTICCIAGVIVAGMHTNEIFIENGRFHGQLIADAVAKCLK